MIAWNDPDSQFFFQEFEVKWVTLLRIFYVILWNLFVAILEFGMQGHMQLLLNHPLIQPLLHPHLILTRQPSIQLQLPTTLGQFRLHTQILVVARRINIKNRRIKTLELSIKSFSDLRAIAWTVTHDASRCHIIILSLCVKSMIVQVLVLVDRVRVSKSWLVALSRVSTGVVDEEAFYVDCQLAWG